jgi:catechol 2,3-dioxygenase-like lactoylglutathione lyase family enzyme
MHIAQVIPQLRTTNLGAAIAFYTATLGFALEFRYEDFYGLSLFRTCRQLAPRQLPAP